MEVSNGVPYPRNLRCTRTSVSIARSEVADTLRGIPSECRGTSTDGGSDSSDQAVADEVLKTALRRRRLWLVGRGQTRKDTC